ncbi:type II secretion system major pseudopilin GspG [Prosthecobacter fluviatilis]|uniref:Type II secretion system core protein G n=1 Tax=Prosthecobacter fluviatilis TaxID=445931 RepID=A0ABW0KRN1_9BACT
MKHLRSSSKNGFTLLEMMVVLLIIALILGTVAFMVQGIQGDAEHVTAGAKIKGLESALTSYKINNLTYPTQEQGLDALVTRPTAEPKPRRWTQQLKPDALTDPWGRKMVYRNPGKHNASGYDVLSLGADGLENTEDDIGNW